MLSVTTSLSRIRDKNLEKIIEKLNISIEKRERQFNKGRAISIFVGEFHHLDPMNSGKFLEYFVFSLCRLKEVGEEIFEAILNLLDPSPLFREGVEGFKMKQKMIDEGKEIVTHYFSEGVRYQQKMIRMNLIGVFDFVTPTSIIEIKVSNSEMKNLGQILAYSAISGGKKKMILINFNGCYVVEYFIGWEKNSMNRYLNWLKE